MFGSLLGLFALFYFGNKLVRLLSNYHAARKLGFPIIVVPFTWQSLVWRAVAGSLADLIARLPFGLGDWVHYSQLGWSQIDRYRTHLRLGPTFTLVSAWKNEVIIADPATCNDVMYHYKAWINDPDAFDLFTVFGRNILSSNGADWQRHRKITGGAFKEENTRAVWDASLRQAYAFSAIVPPQVGQEGMTITRLSEHMQIVTMHVLSAAGFGKEYDFESGFSVKEEGHAMSYCQAMSIIAKNIMMTILFSALKVPRAILPPSLRELSVASEEFRSYMKERVDAVKAGALTNMTVRTNIMGALVQAHESGKNGMTDQKAFLDDEELYGNLFSTNLANFETANAFTFVFPCLAAHPEVQEWAAEETRNILTDQNTSYEDAFPKLVRNLAVMVSNNYPTKPQLNNYATC